MSRFFAARSSGSEDESSDEAPIVAQKATTTVASSRAQFLFSDDDDEDTKRVVRSQKDKRFDEISNIAKQLKNHKKIKDMSKILTEFENLGRAFVKAKNVVDKEGIPTTFIKCLVELENFIKENWDDVEGRRKLNKLNAKALGTLRQKVKKYNKTFENDIEKYRENPLDSEVEEDVDDESGDFDDEDDNIIISTKPEIHAAKIKQEKYGDSDSEYDSDDDRFGSSSGSDSDLDIPQGGKVTAAMFLKKEKDDGEDKKEKKVRKERQIKPKAKIDDAEEVDGAEWKEVKSSHTSEKPKMLFAKDTEINPSVVLKKLHEILNARGKKGTDRTEQISYLKDLRAVAEKHNLGAAMSVKIMFNIIASIFDYNPNAATCMKSEMWKSCLQYVDELLTILCESPNITVGENILEDAENLENANEEEKYKIRGCILITIERTDDEFTKMLQGCDCHSTEYVERLKDEITMTLLISRVMKYLEDHDAAPSMLCRVYLRYIEHIYYKLDMVRVKELNEEKLLNQSSTDENSEEITLEKAAALTTSKMENMCKFIYTKDDSNRIRTRAMLCHVYFLALHDRWYEARDLMLMSHLQENIQHSDIPTQILYNRTMVQLGLCAFRHGMIKDAHNALHDVQSSGKAKELLAQGLMQQRQYERNPEQEK
ncbi:eukaryotic translation initiation factor 3 subunit C-like [Xenia sp. Carnegie-2017]|uniref:eukaryotic translation initiation factor 3 subunit C-like n=1 Tax=Xenia sp. Carnegie-2017 TaxID=2897299 RepID=UPI001F04DB1A|nr:eukaryotic translation initiation factor 3 subunit C-like [Xenia sp. Carnegie-2017]